LTYFVQSPRDWAYPIPGFSPVRFSGLYIPLFICWMIVAEVRDLGCFHLTCSIANSISSPTFLESGMPGWSAGAAETMPHMFGSPYFTRETGRPVASRSNVRVRFGVPPAAKLGLSLDRVGCCFVISLRLSSCTPGWPR